MRNYVLRGLAAGLIVLLGISFVGCEKETQNATGSSADSTTAAGEGSAVPTEGETQNTTVPPVQTLAPTPTKTPTPTNTPVSDPVVEGEGAVLYQVSVKNVLMMSYVIKTKNNKIIVIDGGGDNTRDPIVEYNALMSTLKEASGRNVPTIDAWILTHVHDDHVGLFSYMLTEKADTVNVKKVYYNFPTETYVQKYASGTMVTYNKFKAAITTLNKNQLVTVKMGDTYTFDNVNVNIILAPDETDMSLTGNAVNESSIVFDMKLGGQRVMFLGDLGPYSCSRFWRALKATGSTKVDVLQLGHHGSHGLKKEYYAQMKPSVCLWPTPDWLYSSENGWETITVHQFLLKKGITQHYFMYDGLVRLEFPLKLS